MKQRLKDNEVKILVHLIHKSSPAQFERIRNTIDAINIKRKGLEFLI